MTKEEEILELRDKLYNLTMETCRVRDMLKPIVDGMIQRGHSLAGCPNGVLEPGFRKTKLADARVICNAAILKINNATSRDKTELRG